MIRTDHFFHVIKDPVHGTMQFTSDEDAWLKPFIDSPHFQRLRHIKQLGLGDFIFPGATHTRFNHSLGCCYVSSQITQKIGLSQAERQLVMIACLLHDIGHGPFSHAFEGVFYEKAIRHEDWTPYFLAGYNNEKFFHAYNQRNAKEPLAADKFAIISNMIMHQPVKNKLLADIVSSQLDADRLDYLLRDSHFCGVNYGEFDFRWMLNCLAIVKNKHDKRLGITHKGIGIVEHYLMARRLMMRNIYHGHKKLALESLLVELLVQLSIHLPDYPSLKNIKTTRLGQFLLAANAFNQEIKQRNDRHAIETIKQHFLQHYFEFYQSLCDYDVFAVIDELAKLHDAHPAIQIAQRLQARVMPKIIRLDDHRLDEITTCLADFKLNHQAHFQDWQLMLIHTPHQSYSGEDPIWVVNEALAVNSLGDFSLMVNAIADKLERVAFLAIDKMIIDDERIINLIKLLRNER